MKRLKKVHTFVISLAFLLTLPCAIAQANTTQDVDGYLNPVEDMRYYLEQLDRLPDRLGLICWAAYEVHKEGKHDSAMTLVNACADRGLVASMLMLANLYQNGMLNVGENAKVSALWLKRAAATGDSRGQYYYGLALLRGYGQRQNEALGKQWIALAARQGMPEAIEAEKQWR